MAVAQRISPIFCNFSDDGLSRTSTGDVIVKSSTSYDSAPPPAAGFDWIDFLAGSLAGMSGVIIGHPFDTVKVRQQEKGHSLVRTVSKTVTEEGVAGLYKGLAFPLLTQGLLNSVFFGVYESTKTYLDKNGTAGNDVSYRNIAVAGAVGGGVQALPCTPIELAKIKLQVQTEKSKADRALKGPLHCIRTVSAEHGVRSCFRGLLPCIIRDCTGFAGYMISFEYLCRRFDPRGPEFCSIPVTLLTGGLAGTFSWLINLPVDNIKTRLQADNFKRPQFRSSTHCLSTVLREHGMRAFYRGLPAVIARAFVINGVTLTVYTLARPYLIRLWRQNDD